MGIVGARLLLATAGRNYKKKDGTVVKNLFLLHKCYNKSYGRGEMRRADHLRRLQTG